jgi:pimeloyl-ACP methyl ester carboxylesterase
VARNAGGGRAPNVCDDGVADVPAASDHSALSQPPPRPSGWEERAARFLLTALGPRLPRVERPPTPSEFAPFEDLTIPRRGRPGHLAATWYPAAGARGAVLLLHPWLAWGQAYFFRRGRLQALREAGYHAMTFDLGGFGGSAPPAGLYDRDVEDALAALAERAPGLPLHLWGVSSGGFWSMTLLSRHNGVAGVMFEDVSPHLIGWSHRTAPWLAPCYHLFERLLPRAYHFLDLRWHAPHLAVAAAAFVSGAADPGIHPADTEELARLTRGACRVVAGASHLGAIKRATAEVIALALATFERAEGARAAPGGVNPPRS